jgi:hypothetical protein
MSMEAPRKTKNKLPVTPLSHSQALTPQEPKSGYNGDTCTPIFTVALFTTGKLWNQRWCPSTTEWTKMERVVYLHNGVLVNHKEEWNDGTLGKWWDCRSSYWVRWILHVFCHLWNPDKVKKWHECKNGDRLMVEASDGGRQKERAEGGKYDWILHMCG